MVVITTIKIYARQKLLNTSKRIARFLEVRHAELKAFTGFDETSRMHKIQEYLFTTVACDFSIAAFIFTRKQRTRLNYHGDRF